MFKVDQIDHIHVYVSDKYKAASWYENVLGMEVVKSKESWAQGDGPLVISSDGGNTCFALFNGSGHKDGAAFRVGGEAFLTFAEHASRYRVVSRSGRIISNDDIVDHQMAYSIYFNDPDGNALEVTSYDYDVITHGLKTPATG